VTYVLAVDGGNTKTLAVVAAAATGQVVAAAKGGPSDLYSSPPDVAVAELYRVVDAALERAGVGRERLLAAGLSLAGADWQEDFELHERALADELPGVPARVVNDAIGPIRCIGRDGPAAAMMCGTGAAIGARGADGRVWSLGFTPRSGSAHGLGREALSAIQEADMDCGPPTALTPLVLGAVGVETPRALVREFSRRGGLRDLAALAPHVLAAALAGDAVAVAIVELVGSRMGQWTRHAADVVGITGSFPLVLGGGLLPLPGSALLVDAALAELPDAEPVRLEAEPVIGALLLALDAAGSSVDEPAVLAQRPTALTC
jgi:N-acetylglucosamine kinase-like BadF-type ATPase